MLRDIRASWMPCRCSCQACALKSAIHALPSYCAFFFAQQKRHIETSLACVMFGLCFRYAFNTGALLVAAILFASCATPTHLGALLHHDTELPNGSGLLSTQVTVPEPGGPILWCAKFDPHQPMLKTKTQNEIMVNVFTIPAPDHPANLLHVCAH